MSTDLASIKAIAEELSIQGALSVSKVEAERIDDTTVRLNLMTDEPALLIGHHGENLFALQHLLRLILRKRFGDETEVIVDVDNYRRSQELAVTAMAEEIGARVRSTGVAYEFPPMMSYKRRAIHAHFMQNEVSDLKVFSVGEGADRRVRIERID